MSSRVFFLLRGFLETDLAAQGKREIIRIFLLVGGNTRQEALLKAKHANDEANLASIELSSSSHGQQRDDLLFPFASFLDSAPSKHSPRRGPCLSLESS